MAASRRKQAMFTLAAFGAPIVLVQGMGWVLGGIGPAIVDAAANDPALPTAQIEQSTPAALTPRQRAATARAAEIRLLTRFASPFQYDRPTEGVIPVIPHVRETIIRPPDLNIHGFMSGPRPIVIIDGDPLSVGSVIEDEWRLTSINVARRSITIEHLKTGKSFVISPKKYDPLSEID